MWFCVSIVILMPVYLPRPEHFQAQVQSLAQQQFGDFVCVVSHDGPTNETRVDEIVGVLPDERFEFKFTERRLGSYGHIEQLINSDAQRRPFFAFCDQDDVWLPQRLSNGLEHMSDAEVSAVSANGQIVDDDLAPIKNRTTFSWFGHSVENQRYRFLLNQMTGASMLCRADRFRECAPFPANLGKAVHDHWAYLTASATGRIVLDSRVSWLYRQHDNNQIGASASRGLARRVASGGLKAMSIARIRMSTGHDEVLLQALEFYNVAKMRWPTSMDGNEALPLSLKIHDRARYLSPRALIDSRLESMRLAIAPTS